ncbi:MAG: ABC transporter ATP-binding protein [Pseudomonadota bacterium]
MSDGQSNSQTDGPILAVRSVQVAFPTGGFGRRSSILGVAGVSFEVNRGETFALVGESGSGKTTLARAINGLQAISAGSIAFRGQRIDGLGKREMQPIRRHMSMMFQDPVGSLSPRMTVGDLVTEPFRIHGAEGRDLRAETARLLSLVGLPASFATRFPHQLSGGQARRVGVARALALDPALVIADEPTAGLDVSVQGEVLNLLNDLRERLGLAMVIITHNLHVVHHIADWVAVMYLGRFVEAGDTEAVFARPRHPYTAALLSANPEPDPDKARNRISLPAEVPSLLSRPAGCEFHTRCPWVQARCRAEMPVPELVEHAVACHTPLMPGARPPRQEASP